MFNIANIFSLPICSLNHTKKEEIFLKITKDLNKHHYLNCNEYRNILNSVSYIKNKNTLTYNQLPYLHISLFKRYILKSIKDINIFKTLTSSGTSGQAKSKIFLDKETATLQQKTLIKLVQEFTEIKRSPMLIIDSENVLTNRKYFSARGAAILGFSIFSSKRCFVFKEDMSLDTTAIENFINKYNHQNIFVFGFTSIIWSQFLTQLKLKNLKLNLSNSTLIHGGGWKKLEKLSISNSLFKKTLKDYCSITKIHNYYGMIEQTGSIYIECSKGYLHTNNFNDIIFRNPIDMSICNINQEGVVQTISILPKSYCGHNLLTEDKGYLVGIDTCECGTLGKYFKITGRIKQAEIRGCSDTYGE